MLIENDMDFRENTDAEDFRPGPLSAALIGLSRHTPLGRGQLRKWMAASVRRLNPDRPVDVGLYGGHARLHHTGNNPEIKALMSPHRYAREEYAFCRRHMPQQNGVFVDIGANAGMFSLYMAHLMQSGVIICVEPQNEMFERLSQNFALNPDLAVRLDLHFRKLAVGGLEPGTLELAIPESAGQASARLSGSGQTVKVPQIPLINLVQDVGVQHIDLLKIDVEGFEDEVLYPFFETSPSSLHPGAIVMEACHAGRWQRDCKALLRAHEYETVYEDRTNMMLIKTRQA